MREEESAQLTLGTSKAWKEKHWYVTHDTASIAFLTIQTFKFRVKIEKKRERKQREYRIL
jgi:hypothetical protein